MQNMRDQFLNAKYAPPTLLMIGRLQGKSSESADRRRDGQAGPGWPDRDSQPEAGPALVSLQVGLWTRIGLPDSDTSSPAGPSQYSAAARNTS
jgi:hypothetical protein